MTSNMVSRHLIAAETGRVLWCPWILHGTSLKFVEQDRQRVSHQVIQLLQEHACIPDSTFLVQLRRSYSEESVCGNSTEMYDTGKNW